VDADTLTAVAPASYARVGTILFNMAVNPTTGKLYVSNTESPNQVRFEGPGVHGGSTVQGHLSEARISVLDPATGQVDPQHLNPHLDYSELFTGANPPPAGRCRSSSRARGPSTSRPSARRRSASSPLLRSRIRPSSRATTRRPRARTTSRPAAARRASRSTSRAAVCTC
jgi:hypothetical protein